MNKYLAASLVWFIIAAFFYAAIWTNENNSLSECFMFTGFVLFVQYLCTLITLPIVEELEQ